LCVCYESSVINLISTKKLVLLYIIYRIGQIKLIFRLSEKRVLIKNLWIPQKCCNFWFGVKSWSKNHVSVRHHLLIVTCLNQHSWEIIMLVCVCVCAHACTCVCVYVHKTLKVNPVFLSGQSRDIFLAPYYWSLYGQSFWLLYSLVHLWFRQASSSSQNKAKNLIEMFAGSDKIL
jgi:hypothetical protein